MDHLHKGDLELWREHMGPSLTRPVCGDGPGGVHPHYCRNAVMRHSDGAYSVEVVYVVVPFAG